MKKQKPVQSEGVKFIESAANLYDAAQKFRAVCSDGRAKMKDPNASGIITDVIDQCDELLIRLCRTLARHAIDVHLKFPPSN